MGALVILEANKTEKQTSFRLQVGISIPTLASVLIWISRFG